MAIVKYINKSILEADQKYIAHGVNCRGAMGSGVAKVLFTECPKIREDYLNYFERVVKSYGTPNEQLLGRVQHIEDGDRTYLNCFTQNYFGYKGHKLVSYDAIHTCFRKMVQDGVKEVAIPKIGSGLAGGNWDIISQIIDDATLDKLDVYVYHI